jgi:D-lactate dehydrogenase (cytochrome)
MNELRPVPISGDPGEYRKVTDWGEIQRSYLQYLQDESRMTAPRIEVLHFPTTAAQVAEALRSARSAGHRVAVSGARTGITGAAVPLDAEEVLSVERIKGRPVVRPDGEGGWAVTVGAGVTLADLNDAIGHGLCEYPEGKPERPVFYPVDSTETSAHIGGTIATNASGARTLFYGPTRDWVIGLKVVLADGRLLELRRGEVGADGGVLRLLGEDGAWTDVAVPELPIPDTKHTAGYYLKPGMDAVDLFVGGEGTLGVVVEAELRLAFKPANRLYVMQFVDGADAAIGYVSGCRRHASLSPLALEYIGPNAMALLRSMGSQTPAYVEVSRLAADAAAAVYAEIAFADEAELDAIYSALREVSAAAGLDPARSWAGFSEKDLEEMKRLRHAVPETVNSIIGRRKVQVPELHKVGTDMSVPLDSLARMMAFYRRRLDEAGLESVIFGHIGDGHVHVNILPRTATELEQAEDLYMDFAREAVRLGGSVAAEHGIGRIKRKFLPIQFSDEDVAAMRAVKRAFDPAGTLNPGVLFEA